MLLFRDRWIIFGTAAAAASLVLAGCGQPDSGPAAPGSAASSSPDGPGQETEAPAAAVGLPSRHVHGVAANPADGQVYLATHDGLFRMAEEPELVSPVIDLMGFTVVGPDHSFASGHPGPGTNMPNPVGLIESRDGGRTWTPLSRQGESDFHALTASAGGIVGFDGTLRASADGTSWRELKPPVAPYALATSPDGRTLIATSQSGPVRSTDAGITWEPITGAPLLQLVDWADAVGVVVGVTPGGQVAVSSDAGASWQIKGQVDGQPQALGASGGTAESVRVLVVNDTALLESNDGAVSFRPWRPAS